jgi:hypothetical protein
MSVTDIIDGYSSGEKLESAWIVLAGALAAAPGLVVGGTVYPRLADAGAIPAQANP